MILFHHRAEIGCRGWNRTSIRAFKGRCPTIRRPGNELVESEVVATSPYRIKSPVPVCCGFDSLKMVGERGLAPPRLSRTLTSNLTLRTRPLLCLSYGDEMVRASGNAPEPGTDL